MGFLITAITRVERNGYNDIFWAGWPVLEVVEVKPAPVEAFFEIETVVSGERTIFGAEIRNGKFLQVDWSDEFQDLLMEHSKSKEDWSMITNSIFSVHEDLPVDFPLKIGVAE